MHKYIFEGIYFMQKIIRAGQKGFMFLCFFFASGKDQIIHIKQ